MNDSFEVIAITAKSECIEYCSLDKKDACKVSMGMNKKSNGLPYIVACPDNSRMTINEQRRYLRYEDDCERREDPLPKDEYYNEHPRKVTRL